MTRWLCLLLLMSTLLHAEDHIVKWNGEVRVRGEFDGRDFSNKSAPLLYTLLRTRIGARVEPAADMKIVIQLQDSRYFGQEGTSASATTANSKNVDLREGYIQLDNLFIDGSSTRIGRTALVYGNERFVGAGQWGNTARVFDALLLKYQWDNESVDLFTSNIVETQTPPSSATPLSVAGSPDEGILFSGLVFASRRYAALRGEVFLFHEWNRKETLPGYRDLSRLTAGTRLAGTSDGILYEIEGALQGGKISRTDIQAYMFTISAGYSWPVVTITGGLEYFSGSPSGSVKFKSFEPTYGTGHRFYGSMDYFVSIPAHTGERGFQDLYVLTTLKMSESSLLHVALHHFELTEAVAGRKSIGQELDISGSLGYNSNVSFEGGVSGFLPDEFMRSRFGGADVAWWGYLTTRAWF